MIFTFFETSTYIDAVESQYYFIEAIYSRKRLRSDSNYLASEKFKKRSS